MSEQDWTWGRRPVQEALRSGHVQRVVVAQGTEGRFMREIKEQAESAGVPIETVDRPGFARIVSDSHAQGVAALIEPVRFHNFRDVLAAEVSGPQPALILVLEEIQDPHNLGALLRSGDAAGCQSVFLTRERSAKITAAVAKASAGAVYHLRLTSLKSMSHALDAISAAGIWTVGLSGEAHEDLFNVDLTVPTAIVIGSEGTGLRRLTADRVDRLARIPMRGRVESLNASVAGAIALFEAVRQRARANKSEGRAEAGS